MKTATQKQWVLNPTPVEEITQKTIENNFNFTPSFARFLIKRGYDTTDKIKRFFNLLDESVYDPFLLTDMDKAVHAIEQALEEKKKILIYGDYDVDGVTATAVLYLYLQSRGADVSFYLPKRKIDGYGLSPTRMEDFHGQGISFIITVDTGITAVEAVNKAKEYGIDVVITDHHAVPDELPQALACVDPHRKDDKYPFSDLCGAGVSFKLVWALETKKAEQEGRDKLQAISQICYQYLDLVAVGTIADVMPLLDENRLFVKQGLKSIQNNPRLGLASLMDEINKNKNAKITSPFISFQISPRMNAAGRMEDAEIALNLMLAKEESKSIELAQKLCDLNTKRQEMESSIADSINQKISDSSLENDSIIILEDDSWDQGIIGIVASRIVERFGKPAILITYDGATRGYPANDDIGKGSGRSIEGVNLVECLNACKDLLVGCGGHEQAAGLSVKRENVLAFKNRMNYLVTTQLNGKPCRVTLPLDMELNGTDLTLKFAEELEKIEPVGVGNPIPAFLVENALILSLTPISNGKHIKMAIRKDNVTLDALWFNHESAHFPYHAGMKVDIACGLSINEYCGMRSTQLIVQDMRENEESLKEKTSLYERIMAGEKIPEEADVLPTRADFGVLWKCLKEKNGKSVLYYSPLIDELKTDYGVSFNECKLRIALKVLDEIKCLSYREASPECFIFSLLSVEEKKSLDDSQILNQLKKQS